MHARTEGNPKAPEARSLQETTVRTSSIQGPTECHSIGPTFPPKGGVGLAKHKCMDPPAWQETPAATAAAREAASVATAASRLPQWFPIHPRERRRPVQPDGTKRTADGRIKESELDAYKKLSTFVANMMERVKMYEDGDSDTEDAPHGECVAYVAAVAKPAAGWPEYKEPNTLLHHEHCFDMIDVMELACEEREAMRPQKVLKMSGNASECPKRQKKVVKDASGLYIDKPLANTREQMLPFLRGMSGLGLNAGMWPTNPQDIAVEDETGCQHVETKMQGLS